MKERIIKGWNFMRVLWLIMGIGIGVQAIEEKNYLMLLPALYFAFAAIANFGCCASGACATNLTGKDNNSSITEINFEEIKSKT